MMIRRILSSSFAPKLFTIQSRTLKRPAINQSQLTQGRRTGALAMKVGMIPLWDQWGARHAATILHLDECEVTKIQTMESDGYTSLQLGVGEKKLRRVGITELGYYKASGVKPKRQLMEFRVTPDELLPLATRIRAMHFVPGQLVDVCGISKGKGFQGVMKRHNFSGGRASHGNSVSHRSLGSTGCRQDPGRVFKNKKMPGRMGGDRTTTQNLTILKIDPERDLIYVKGGVPGNAGTFCRIVDAVKGPFWPVPPPRPTYLLGPDDPEFPKYELLAPAGETDRGKLKEPDDAY